MRLINADALIKKLEEMANDEWNISVGSSKGLEDAIDVVENFPTIELDNSEAGAMQYTLGYNDGFMAGLNMKDSGEDK